VKVAALADTAAENATTVMFAIRAKYLRAMETSPEEIGPILPQGPASVSCHFLSAM
jgi:hypothetical protein